MNTRKRSHWGVALFLVLCASITAFGQLYTGTITGVVKDPSGAVVPNAKVTLTDDSKGYTYTATSDNSGIYTARNLPPTTYTARVAMPGFADFVRPGIVLDVDGNVTVNVELQVASSGQRVTVSEASAPLLQTEDSVTGQTLNRTTINDLPLINRQVFDLAFLAPGVTQAPNTTYGNGTVFATNFTSDGSRNAQADILLDGVSATSEEQNTGISKPLYVPPVDAVQEYRVQQSNFSAEIGQSGGTVINVVTRSGTNQFHGELFEFFRNNDLNANTFFANAAGQSQAHSERNDFGGTVGGPIIKNKTFFFFDYNGIRALTGSTSGEAGVPDAAERSGNFGELCSRAGGSFNSAGICSNPAGQIFDPFTGHLDAAGNGDTGRTAIPFNNLATYQSPGNPLSPRQLAPVPGNLIDPVGAKLITYFPFPNLNVGAANYDPYHNWIGEGSVPLNQKSFDIRIDHRFTDLDNLSFRFSHEWNTSLGFGPDYFGNGFSTSTQGPTADTTYLGSINYTHTFSPRTVMTVSFGYAHDYNPTQGSAALIPGFSPVKTLGMPAYIADSGIDQPPAIQLGGPYGCSGFNGCLGGQGWSVLKYASETAHLIGSVDHVAGNHEIKIGGEVRRHRINFLQAGLPAGIYNPDQFGTASGAAAAGGVGGDSLATLLIGYNDGGFSEYEIPPSLATQSFDYGGFVQDNWHVNSRLTLNLGFRYDVELPRTERYNRMNFFDPGATAPITVPGLPLHGALEYVGVDGNPRNQFDTWYGGVGPRFGFAYRIGNNSTVRGGYGIFYDPSDMGAAGAGPGGTQGYQAITNAIVNLPTDPAVPNSFLSNPFPQGILQVTGNSLGTSSELGQAIAGAPYRLWNQIPQEQSWSFGVEHQFPWSLLVDAEYVGRKGTHLYAAGVNNLDLMSPQEANAFRANPALYNSFVSNPFYGIITDPTSTLSNKTVQYYQLLLPYPQYTAVNASFDPAANSIYNALQLKAEKRFSHGVQFLVTYVWSKSIDDASSGSTGFTFINGGGLGNIPQDPNNLALNRSVSAFNIPQVFQASFVYQLPFGRHQAYGSNLNPILDAFLGGWQVNGIYRWDDGLPLGLGLNGGTSLPGYGPQAPNLNGPLTVCGTGNLNQYFCGSNPSSVLSVPLPYTDGSAPRYLPNDRVPGTNNLTASLFKQFPLGFREGAMAEIRLETFNTLNRVQFAGPDTAIPDPNFGKITAQANSPRQVQIGVKLYF
jgi:hypothetical protein